jgi:hypothetical protein
MKMKESKIQNEKEEEMNKREIRSIEIQIEREKQRIIKERRLEEKRKREEEEEIHERREHELSLLQMNENNQKQIVESLINKICTQRQEFEKKEKEIEQQSDIQRLKERIFIQRKKLEEFERKEMEFAKVEDFEKEKQFQFQLLKQHKQALLKQKQQEVDALRLQKELRELRHKKHEEQRLAELRQLIRETEIKQEQLRAMRALNAAERQQREIDAAAQSLQDQKERILVLQRQIERMEARIAEEEKLILDVSKPDWNNKFALAMVATKMSVNIAVGVGDLTKVSAMTFENQKFLRFTNGP